MFLLWLRQLPKCGDWTPASVPPPTEGRSSPTNTPIFPPSPFIVLNFVWFCIFFSAGQVFLSALNCCSACTCVSECVFLMYPWREESRCSSGLLQHADEQSALQGLLLYASASAQLQISLQIGNGSIIQDVTKRCGKDFASLWSLSRDTEGEKRQ